MYTFIKKNAQIVKPGNRKILQKKNTNSPKIKTYRISLILS